MTTFNEEFVDMIYIDTEMTDVGKFRTTLTMFDLGNGTSRPLVIGYSFDEQVNKIASIIDEKFPVQVIFDSVGVNQSFKDAVIKKLEVNHRLYIDKFGHTATL